MAKDTFKVTITIESDDSIEVIEIPCVETVERTFLYNGSFFDNALQGLRFTLGSIRRPGPNAPEITSSITAKEK